MPATPVEELLAMMHDLADVLREPPPDIDEFAPVPEWMELCFAENQLTRSGILTDARAAIREPTDYVSPGLAGEESGVVGHIEGDLMIYESRLFAPESEGE